MSCKDGLEEGFSVMPPEVRGERETQELRRHGSTGRQKGGRALEDEAPSMLDDWLSRKERGKDTPPRHKPRQRYRNPGNRGAAEKPLKKAAPTSTSAYPFTYGPP